MRLNLSFAITIFSFYQRFSVSEGKEFKPEIKEHRVCPYLLDSVTAVAESLL